MRIILATNNRHKVREMQAILAPAGAELITPDSLGLDFSVEETGDTFRANALIKARACHAASGLPALGDDSGLVVRALGGRPGVHSARYAGQHGDDEANLRRVLDELEEQERGRAAAGDLDRGAAFVCSLAFVEASGEEHFFEGQVAGVIAKSASGSGGFGYDPIFYLPEKGCTMAELPFSAKNELSHRARALADFVAWITERVSAPFH